MVGKGGKEEGEEEEVGSGRSFIFFPLLLPSSALQEFYLSPALPLILHSFLPPSLCLALHPSREAQMGRLPAAGDTPSPSTVSILMPLRTASRRKVIKSSSAETLVCSAVRGNSVTVNLLLLLVKRKKKNLQQQHKLTDKVPRN